SPLSLLQTAHPPHTRHATEGKEESGIERERERERERSESAADREYLPFSALQEAEHRDPEHRRGHRTLCPQHFTTGKDNELVCAASADNDADMLLAHTSATAKHTEKERERESTADEPMQRCPALFLD
ncbi:hypothetical protein DNTS_028815, partial [Danionella cerebrum]